MQYLRQNTSALIIFGPFVDKADGVTLKTDATTITDIDHAATGIFLSKAGASAAIRHAPVTASVVDSYGMMKVTLDATDTDTVGTLDVLFAKGATYLPVHKCFEVVPANVFDSLMGTDLLDTNVSTNADKSGYALSIAGVAAVQAGLSTLSAAQVNAEIVDALRVDTIPDSVSVDGAQPTLAQAIYQILQFLTEKSIAGLVVTVNKPDGATAMMTLQLDNVADPHAITRTA